MSTTPLMSLVLPVPSVTLGPEWATTLNTALELVDSHDHSSGKGTKVTPAGFNVNADMEFNSYNLKEVKSLRLDNQVLALGGTNDVRCLYTVAGELYFNDSNGNQVRLTNAGAIDISTTGGITGDYTTSSADVSYSNVSKTFMFDQSLGVRAKIDAADLIIREAVASANSITLKSPVSLASSYAWSFPAALPTSTSKFLQVTTTGALENNIDVDNSGIEINSNLIQLKNLGVTTSKINDLAVTTVKINDLAVTTAKINDLAVTTAKLADSNVTTAKLANEAVTHAKRIQTYSDSAADSITTVNGNNDTSDVNVEATDTGGGDGKFLAMIYISGAGLASFDSGDRIYLRDSNGNVYNTWSTSNPEVAAGVANGIIVLNTTFTINASNRNVYIRILDNVGSGMVLYVKVLYVGL